jgi:hypothetical protein
MCTTANCSAPLILMTSSTRTLPLLYVNGLCLHVFLMFNERIINRLHTRTISRSSLLATSMSPEFLPGSSPMSRAAPALPAQLRRHARARQSPHGLKRYQLTSKASTRTTLLPSVMRASSTSPAPALTPTSKFTIFKPEYYTTGLTYNPRAGGSIGIDFVANLNISTLDFGTFHNYPNPWGQGSNETLWGEQ